MPPLEPAPHHHVVCDLDTPGPGFPDFVRDDALTLETARLWLRWPRLADVEAVARYCREERVAEMTGSVPHPLPDGDTMRFITQAREANGAGLGLTLVLTPKARPNEAIGSVAVRPGKGSGRLSLGYLLSPDQWGRGFATEAAGAMIDLAFQLTPVREVTAWVRVVNPASRRILEKCGFQPRGSGLRDLPARGGQIPCDDFGLDRGTWRSLRRWPQGAASGIAGPTQPVS